MRLIKNICTIVMLMMVTIGCTKTDLGSTDFIQSQTAPQNLSGLFEITQNNSGLVTITPNGEGVSYYEVFYGDAAKEPAKVSPGKNTQHVYAEGNYNVKIVAHSLSGQVIDYTKQLTVTFRAPENVEVSAAIDAANGFKVNVTASAAYETFFKIYFGDAPNEVPFSFLEDQTISHVYAAPGTYQVKVVAYSGGAATTTVVKNITIVNPVNLPLTFEAAIANYKFMNFDGGDASIVTNPKKNGINTSDQVGKMIKHAGQTWGGSVLSLSGAIDFSTNKIFKMKLFSPRVGAKVLLKVENATDGSINYEKEVKTTVANAWEDLIFDYTGINTSKAYHKIVLIFDNGAMGDGSSNFTFLFDDIRLVPDEIGIPLNFESATLNYEFLSFDGGNTSVVPNPQMNGTNTSLKVGKMVKQAGQVWGGSFISLAKPIDFSVLKTFRMKVFSPRANAKVLLKVENLTNGAISFEKEMSVGAANVWTDLSFDYSGIDVSKSYQKVVLIFDLGTMGDGSANYTFL
ncbi:MAG TPA: PKD domain-containing protein, partial [Niabella sp.]|nr:PKD domain-containing protein [Niabella sp.]